MDCPKKKEGRKERKKERKIETFIRQSWSWVKLTAGDQLKNSLYPILTSTVFQWN